MGDTIGIIEVKFGSDSRKTYYYTVEDFRPNIGDNVIVPVGNDGTQRIAQVVAVYNNTPDKLPIPIEKIKKAIRIIDTSGGVECPICNKVITADECYEIEMCADGLGPKDGVPYVADIDLIKKNAELCSKCCFHSFTPFYSEDDVIMAHRYSSSNMPDLKNDSVCGCFYCLSIFSPSEITEWIQGGAAIDEQGTAICPYCGVDSIIGQSSGYPITKTFLSKMKKYWF